MVNKRLEFYNLGVLVDDVWLSGTQSVNTPSELTVNALPDNGRIQSSKVIHDPSAPITITISRLITDISAPFYTPASLVDYASTFLLANQNIGLSGWDSLKEYKIEIVYGQDDEPYLGEASTTYYALETFNYCLLTGVQYEFAPKEAVVETLTFETRNSSTVNSGLYSTLALPTFPEMATPLTADKLDLVNTIVPNTVSTVFDNGYNAAEGRDAEHGKYALTGLSLSLNIEYGNYADKGRPRGSVDATKQNYYRFVSDTTVETTFAGLARKEGVDQSVNDTNYNPFATPDEEIKVVASLGSNYYVWDLGSKNFLTGVDESMASTPNTRGEYTLSYSNRRHDFVPYINSSILTLTQTGTY